jgi:glycosyltransferase involved in cell wall biosynthesis
MHPETPEISVVLIVHNMRREAPRTLRSLTPGYQQCIRADQYEVIVVENGSTDPLDPVMVTGLGGQFTYHYLTHPPPSPAFAINYGAALARGRILAIMIDGACLLTPGVLATARRAFGAFENPVVMTRYYYMGPGKQNISMTKGYNQQAEDALLEKIGWPGDGYRLFEVGTPLLISSTDKFSWFYKMFESGCLFMHRKTFEAIGRCDERFDIPGGGFLNMDLYREAARLPDTDIIQLIGEGTFHQLHGGATTNIRHEDQARVIENYRRQYVAIRGEEFAVSPKKVYFLGHIPSPRAAGKAGL